MKKFWTSFLVLFAIGCLNFTAGYLCGRRVERNEAAEDQVRILKNGWFDDIANKRARITNWTGEDIDITVGHNSVMGVHAPSGTETMLHVIKLDNKEVLSVHMGAISTDSIYKVEDYK